MFIKKIKGTYGILNDREISFKNGLNIINRDNEWGKTTLISFIKVMFYGVNTSKRDKKDFLSEKTKYTSNTNFKGEMLIEFENRELLVSRSQSSKTMSYDAIYTDLNQKTPYTSKDFGVNILSVSEDAFVNSALIEADNRLISKSADLLNLILAMSTTGDTTNSFERASKLLKEQKQLLTKTSGDLKSRTLELEKINNDLKLTDEIEQKTNQLTEYKNATELEYNKKREEYEDKYREISITKLELVERANIIKSQSNQILQGLEQDFYDIEAILSVKSDLCDFEEIESLEYNLRLEVNQSTIQTSSDITKLNEERAYEIRENSKVAIKKIPFAISVIFAISTFLTMFVRFDFGSYSQYSTWIFGGLTLISLIISFSSNKDHGDVNLKYDEQISILEDNLEKIRQNHQKVASKIEYHFNKMIYNAKNIGMPNAQNKDEIRDRINFTIDINSRYLKALEFQKNTKNDANIYNLEKVQTLENELDIVRRDLKEKERHFTEVYTELMRHKIKLDGISPKNQLIFEKETKEFEISNINFKIKSLDLAIETLNQANENLTARLSPEISKIASKYFAFLTDDKYDSVILQSDFEAFCKNPDNYSHLSKLHLSTATREQLYFSLRLAICDVLIHKNSPIILDDPFAFYDDKRVKKALILLNKVAKTRQILLFTSNSREESCLNEILS